MLEEAWFQLWLPKMTESIEAVWLVYDVLLLVQVARQVFQDSPLEGDVLFTQGRRAFVEERVL